MCDFVDVAALQSLVGPLEMFVPMRVSTENGDKALATSGDACLDFFTRITRNAAFSDYIDAFDKAWSENKETAIKILMNMRDVRTGKGEKLIPTVILLYIKVCYPGDIYNSILTKMTEYGYWKDLLRIIEMESRFYKEESKKAVLPSKSIEVVLFAEQLKKDHKLLLDSKLSSSIDNKKVAVSLCAKWAPSEKTHYNHHPMFAATNIMNEMGLKPKDYRQMLTKLRNHLCVLEMLMCNNRLDEIDFSKVPSVAMMKMKKAFMRDTNADNVESDNRKKLHQSYKEYLENLAKGKAKVNIKGIHPHEIVGSYLHKKAELDPLIEAQWLAIKKRVMEAGVFRNVTAVVDVSSSMSGQPMEVSIALGILVAECTMGPFHGRVITFHQTPTWHQLVGTNLKEQVKCMEKAPWGGSTNLRAVFDLILHNAKSAQLTQDEMVKTLFIFTDMQFNQCDNGNWESTFEYSKRTFQEAGYVLPNIICWNLRTSNSKTMPVNKNEEGFAMLSGFSAELLKCVLNGEEYTPYSMMMHVLEPYFVPDQVTNYAGTKVSLDNKHLGYLEAAITKSAIKKAFKPPKEVPIIAPLPIADCDSVSDAKTSSSESDSSVEFC